MGHGKGLIPPEKLKLAMAFRGKNRHYEWDKINIRHLRETARRCGLEGSIDVVLAKLADAIPNAIAAVSASLPSGFPGEVAEPILKGFEERNKLLGV